MVWLQTALAELGHREQVVDAARANEWVDAARRDFARPGRRAVHVIHASTGLIPVRTPAKIRLCLRITRSRAGVTQLAECLLPKH